MDILIDLYQQNRINDARSTAEEARSAARNTEWQMHDLKRKVASLTITCQALSGNCLPSDSTWTKP
jgi:hypothetical protein